MKRITQEKNEKGITLISLIITIVVLLILAGASLNLVVGQNGLITKAKQAKQKTEQARKDEEKSMSDLSGWIDETVESTEEDTPSGDNTGTGSGGDNTGTGTGGNTPSGGDSGNTGSSSTVDGVKIPEGFVYVGGTKSSGLVISDNSADKDKYKGKETVGKDLQGNQFVWIPVETISDYKKTYYTGSSSYYAETLPEDEKTSVNTNKGFYIGRYEAGDQSSTTAKKLRTSTSTVSNTIAIKAGQAPYNYVSQPNAKTLAEGFYKKQGYKAKTKLVSSYAWDTAIAFMQTEIINYGSSSSEGNYKDSPTFTYTNISGTSANTKGTLIPTGQTTPVCNIYDMGGNVAEFTTETYSGSTPVERGGYYGDAYKSSPAGYRGSDSSVAEKYGFRITLFM